jgi:hypothetical protein
MHELSLSVMPFCVGCRLSAVGDEMIRLIQFLRHRHWLKLNKAVLNHDS